MKAQSQIIQFILFFAIGLTFLTIVGNVFRFQSDIIKSDILDAGSNVTSKYLSAIVIKSVDGCHSCDNISTRIQLNTIAGYNPDVRLNNGILLSIEPENKLYQVSAHNLFNSITYSTSKVLSVKPITLTYDKTKNNLVVQ
ncbi:MAG: hypothetical protein HYW22_01545 [Candidatus Aenigmarchaeota archaeon]|nr:hypothetical protein [Candidatus Aenigmarchaeota archaeon]